MTDEEPPFRRGTPTYFQPTFGCMDKTASSVIGRRRNSDPAAGLDIRGSGIQVKRINAK